MKVYQKGDALDGTKPGEVRIMPEELEDLWHAYNLIAIGDEVTSLAIRKVQRETTTGSVDSQRVKINMTILVATVDFDPEGEELRLSGTVQSEIEGIRIGSRHTLTLAPHRQFTVRKLAWDSVSTARLREAASDPSARADLWAVLIKDGLAQLCHVSGGMTIVKAKLETHIPKKGAPQALLGAKKTREHWFDQLLSAILRHINFGALKCVVLAGPGFTKDAFWEWMGAAATKRNLRELSQSRPKWVLAHASSAYKHALREVLLDPTVAARVAETRAGAEVAALGEMVQMMGDEPDRVAYGLRHVQAASEQAAIAKLLLADTLFRANNVSRRKAYVELVESCQAAGAKVLIFSDQHVSGAQLKQLSGVAAILRYPLPMEDLEESEEEEDDDDDDDDEPESEEEEEDSEGFGAAELAQSAGNLELS